MHIRINGINRDIYNSTILILCDKFKNFICHNSSVCQYSQHCKLFIAKFKNIKYSRMHEDLSAGDLDIQNVICNHFIYELFKQSPESFFDGGVFASGVKADVTSELLGSELVGGLHKRSIRQSQNNLERIAIFTASQTRVDEGKADVTVLNQVRLAATALSQRMN